MPFKKYAYALTLLSLIILLTSSCQPKQSTTVLKLGHGLDPSHVVHQAMLFMGKRLKQLSDNSMALHIYPSAQLGSERELVELLQIGSLAMTKVSASPLEGFIPEFKIFSIPYIFRDHTHFWQTLENEIGEALLLKLTAVELVGLGYYDAGARSFYTLNHPVNKPSDLSGEKIRVQNSATSVAMINQFGGAATPIAWGELYTALQQGVVDGAENNPPSFYLSKHYEVARYFSLDEHTYVPDVLLISRSVWNKLSKQQQQWVQQASDESIIFQRQLWATKTQDSLKALEEDGVTINHPNKQAFRDSVKPMHEAYKNTSIGKMIDAIAAIE